MRDSDLMSTHTMLGITFLLFPNTPPHPSGQRQAIYISIMPLTTGNIFNNDSGTIATPELKNINSQIRKRI